MSYKTLSLCDGRTTAAEVIVANRQIRCCGVSPKMLLITATFGDDTGESPGSGHLIMKDDSRLLNSAEYLDLDPFSRVTKCCGNYNAFSTKIRKLSSKQRTSNVTTLSNLYETS